MEVERLCSGTVALGKKVWPALVAAEMAALVAQKALALLLLLVIGYNIGLILEASGSDSRIPPDEINRGKQPDTENKDGAGENDDDDDDQEEPYIDYSDTDSTDDFDSDFEDDDDEDDEDKKDDEGKDKDDDEDNKEDDEGKDKDDGEDDKEEEEEDKAKDKNQPPSKKKKSGRQI